MKDDLRIFHFEPNAKISQLMPLAGFSAPANKIDFPANLGQNHRFSPLFAGNRAKHFSPYLLLVRDSSKDQLQNELQAAIDHLEKVKGLL